MTAATAHEQERLSLAERLIGNPARLRRLLIRMGPAFLKVGQFLALRPDLIPQKYADELLLLLGDVNPVSWTEARRILERELGPVERNFAFIDPVPVAAGS